MEGDTAADAAATATGEDALCVATDEEDEITLLDVSSAEIRQGDKEEMHLAQGSFVPHDHVVVSNQNIEGALLHSVALQLLALIRRAIIHDYCHVGRPLHKLLAPV